MLLYRSIIIFNAIIMDFNMFFEKSKISKQNYVFHFEFPVR